MKIYLITRTDDYGYDEYDSCVVVAINRTNAIKESCEACDFDERYLNVKHIGFATDKEKESGEGVILDSFNAG